MNNDCCYHCGLPNPSRPLTLSINKEDRSFCCIGCKGAAETILASGLGEYYRFHQPDQQPVESSLTARQKQSLTVYDRDDIQAEFVTQVSEQNRQCILIVEGISCSACSWLIEKRLLQITGISDAIVNSGTHRLSVTWNNDSVSLSGIFSALILIGYRASPFLPSEEETVRQRTQKQFILRLGVAGIGMMQAMMNAVALYSGSISSTHESWLWWTSLFLTIPVILISARPFFIAGWHAIASKQLTMDVSVSIAILSAFFASVYATLTGHGEVYYESVNMFTFFLVLSRFLEFRARTMAAHNANSLAGQLPQTCALVCDTNVREVSVRDLTVGDTIELLPGETCPVDGEIVNGQTEFDESSISGEFSGVPKTPGDSVYAGTINRSQKVTINVVNVGAASSFNILQKLIERAGNEKPKLAELADRGSRQFIWSTLIISLLIGIVWYWVDPSRAFWIVISVLVVTCPCALSLATPTALSQATLNLKQQGFVITRGYALERLAKLTDIAFDKTGTLTEGRFALTETILTKKAHELNLTAHHILHIAKTLEQSSEHNLARAFDDVNEPENAIEMNQGKCISGAGVQGQSRLGCWKLGSSEFASQPIVLDDKEFTQLYLTLNDELVARFILTDSIRSTAEKVFQQLANASISTHVLTGDPNKTAETQFRTIGLTGTYLSNCSPEDKVEWVEKYSSNNIAVVGDGINDAPLLARASLSIAMMEATDLTKSQADILLLTNHLPAITQAIAVAQKTHRIIRQNLIWALLYNAIALPVAALGWVTPWQAAIGMSVSSLIVVGNALRLRR